MSKRLRDSIFFIFIFLFIILSLSISLYAAGYRLVWSWPLNLSQTLQRTGMLIIESRPSNALVEINRRLSGNKISTPAKISNLLPGEYIIRLEKDGYWPLERRIRIFPNQTTHLTNIFLFKKSLPVNIYNSEAQGLMISPHFSHLIFPEENQVFNLKSENVLNLPTNLNPNSLSWSLDSKKIIVGGKIIDLNSGQIIIDLNSVLNKEIKHIKWDELNNRFFYQENNNIYYFSLLNNEAKLLISSEKILDYLIKGNRLHSIEKENNSLYLNTYIINSQQKTRSILLPNGDYQFHFPFHPSLNIYDKTHKRLILINDNILLNQQRIIENVINWYWPDTDHLLWHNGHEIYSLKENQGERLLLRISNEITGFAWHSQRNYLIYSTDNSIFLSFSENNKSRSLEILRASNINSLFLDQKNNIIYFQAKIGRQSGLFKLFVQ
jgi:hypothetical protein